MIILVNIMLGTSARQYSPRDLQLRSATKKKEQSKKRRDEVYGLEAYLFGVNLFMFTWHTLIVRAHPTFTTDA